MSSAARLRDLEGAFRSVVEARLPASGAGVTFASAWLATDNIVVHLLRKHFPEMKWSLLGVDTLHLFPETHAVAAAVQARYGVAAALYKPVGCATRADFEARHGSAETLNHADFDLHSKVEPYQRGLKALGKDILVTGRRSDQGDKRVQLDAWEAQPRILNPMTDWRWDDVTAFVDREGVPVNAAHGYAFRAPAPIAATARHRADAPWTKVDLGKPFWRATHAATWCFRPVESCRLACASLRESLVPFATSELIPHRARRGA